MKIIFSFILKMLVLLAASISPPVLAQGSGLSSLLELLAPPPTTQGESLSNFDYSYGFQKAQIISKSLWNKNYTLAESLLADLSATELTITVDHLALNTGEAEIRAWLENSNSVEFPQLVLGIYFEHKSWVIREYRRYDDMPEKDRALFIEYEQRARDLLERKWQNTRLDAEAQTRLIRIYSSLGDKRRSNLSYYKSLSLSPDNPWAYIHRSESLLPKWGGSIAELNQFIGGLPNNHSTQTIVQLKLTYDSLNEGVDYLNDGSSDIEKLYARTRQLLKTVDQSLSRNPFDPATAMIVNDYMLGISDSIEDEALLYKYYSKVDEKYTLYPSGIISPIRPIDWNDEQLSWHSYRAGIEKIRKSDKPGLLIIYTDWCPTCKEYSKLFKNKDAITSLQDVILIRVNKDRDPAISSQFDFDGEYIPRTFALNRDADVIRKFYSVEEDYAYFIPPDNVGYLVELVGLLKAYK